MKTNATSRVLGDISIADCVPVGVGKASEYFEMGTLLVSSFNSYAIPVIALLGTIGNVLSLIILLQPQMRKSSMNIALIGLSSFDLLLVLSAFFHRSVGQQWVKFLSDPNLRRSVKEWSKAIVYPFYKIGKFHEMLLYGENLCIKDLF